MQKSSHYNDVIMRAMVSQITSFIIVYSTYHSGGDQRKHQSSASLAFVCGIPRWPVNSPHKGSVTRKMFPFDDVIMHPGIGIDIVLLQRESNLPDIDLLINTWMRRKMATFCWWYFEIHFVAWSTIKNHRNFFQRVLPVRDVPALAHVMAWC